MELEQTAALFHAVQTRPRPEDVAALVLEVLGPTLRPGERAVLEGPARRSFRHVAGLYSSMAADFQRPVGAHRQVGRAAVLFDTPGLSAADCLDVAKVETFVRRVGETIRKTFGESSFLHQRLNRAQRAAAGLTHTGHRAYNKRFRLLVRLERKIATMILNVRRYEMTRIANSGLAFRLRLDDLATSADTACLAAYLGARMSMRSVFTNGPQERPFDEVCEMLLRRCEASRDTRWDVLAHLISDRRVVRHLTEQQRGQMLGAWWEVLVEAAVMLKAAAGSERLDRTTMIVRRGNDSSTWNSVAGAWNKARDGWLSLAAALGMHGLVDALCPGKVMRMMAADVARWHLASGGGIHPDTKVWAALPLPWDVVRGDATCSRATVEAACRDAGVDAKGWTVPRDDRVAVAWKPTPELVHGVEVSSPALALALRKAGVFSGRRLRHVPPTFAVQRDEHGAALRAAEGED